MASVLPVLYLREVFQLFDDDAKTLYSCVLVNRHWCHNAIPYLWRRALMYTDASYSSSISLINALVSGLPEQDLRRLGTDDQPRSTFQYANFLRHFDFKNLARATSEWRSAIGGGAASPQSILQTLCRHLLASDALFVQMHLDFDTSLDDYDWGEDDWNFFKFSGANHSLSHLSTLSCLGAYDPILLLSASTQCTNIQSIEVSLDTFGWTRYQRWELMIKAGAETLVALITAQRDLRKFHLQDCHFRGFAVDLSNIFDALKSAHKTLEHIQFSTIDVQGYPLLDVLGQCEKLETLVFNHCQNIGKYINKKPVKPYFPKIKTLLLDKTFIPVPTLRAFTVNAGESLEQVLLRGDGYQENWNAVQVFANNNPNITQFQVHGAITELDQILSLVDSWHQLESLSIMQTKEDNEDDESFDANSFIVDLGASLPETMRHLTIQLDLEFCAESLWRFYKNYNGQLYTLEIPATKCFSNQHLGVVVKHASDTLQHLNVMDAEYLSESAILEASKVIPKITSSVYLVDSTKIYHDYLRTASR